MAKKCHRIAEKRRCKRMALGVSSHPRASSDVTVCCRALQTLKGKARFHHWLTLCPSHLHLSFVKPGLLCMEWFKSSKCQLNIQWNWNRRVTSSTNPRFEKSCGNAHASHSRMTMIIKKNSRNIISFSSKVWHLFKQYCVLISKTYSAFGPHYSQNFFHSRTTQKKKLQSEKHEPRVPEKLRFSTWEKQEAAARWGQGRQRICTLSVVSGTHSTWPRARTESRGWHWVILSSLSTLATPWPETLLAFQRINALGNTCQSVSEHFVL